MLYIEPLRTKLHQISLKENKIRYNSLQRTVLMQYVYVTVSSRDFSKQLPVAMKNDLLSYVKTEPQFKQFV